jgi:hypothetical protein
MQKVAKKEQISKQVLWIVLGAVFLLFPAFYNGYPLVYADTSTYLSAGFELETPLDRPITYSLFLRIASLNGASLWSVIFIQGLLISYLIHQLLLILFPAVSIRFFRNTLFFLALGTTLPWTVSQLIPDIFTPVLLLCVTILLVGHTQLSKKTTLALYSLFLVATAMHISHFTFNIIFLLGIYCLSKLGWLLPKGKIHFRSIAIFLLLTGISFITMSAAISKSKHGFLMGAMIENGVIQPYLEEYCPTEDYQICAYRNELPDRGYLFLWDEASPFYQLGGWKNTKEEFNTIIYHTLTEPKYIGLHIQASLRATFNQLCRFRVGDGNGMFLEKTLLYQRIQAYIGHEIPIYSNSRQNKQTLFYINYCNWWLYSIVLLSIVVFLFRWKIISNNPNLYFVTLLLLIAILLNAWSCGTFANAINRLGSKVIWLFPLLVWCSLSTKKVSQ